MPRDDQKRPRAAPMRKAAPTDPGATGSSDLEPEARAQSFRKTRRARRDELSEDYVELIADLIAEGGEARQVDIAARLGVAQPTVAKMLKRLADDGLVQQRPYRGVLLTDAGDALARRAGSRHAIVLSFLRAIGVSDDTARLDSEGIEHHVSDETLAAMQRFTELSRSRRGR